jgi:DNA repair protein REV1
MKVARPEWLVESAKAGVLLPWKDFIFVPVERPTTVPGSKSGQSNLPITARPPALKLKPNPKFPPVPSPPRISAISKGAGTRPRPPVLAPEPVKTPTKPSKPISSNRLKAIQEALNVKDQDKDEANAKEGGEEEDSVKEQRRPKYAEHESNPIAARVMADPQWRKAHTSVAPDFIEGYYKNSRLHHLSTWKAELKNLVLEAQEHAEAGEQGLVGVVESEELSDRVGVSMKGAGLVMRSPTKGKGKERAVDDLVIMHCDFDCFFVSAGLVSRPHLKGKPAVVCHSQGAQGGLSSTSEIASASYEARSFGIKNGMRFVPHWHCCPLTSLLLLKVFNKLENCVQL